VGGPKINLERVGYFSVRFQRNRCHFFPNSLLNSPPPGLFNPLAAVLFAAGESSDKPATDRSRLQVAQLQLAGWRRFWSLLFSLWNSDFLPRIPLFLKNLSVHWVQVQ